MKTVAPWIGLVMAAASLYFFYELVVFLTARDYVAALVTVFVGFGVLKAGIELARMGLPRDDGTTRTPPRASSARDEDATTKEIS